MGFGDLYTAALILTVFLVAPFNALARVIVVTWGMGEIAYRLGVPELQVNLVQHLAGLIVGARYLRTTACAMAYVIFASLFVVDAFRLIGPGLGEFGWWTVLSLALLQLAFLPFGIEWKQVQALRAGGLRAYWAARPTEYLRVGA
jgi:hypothetical protein